MSKVYVHMDANGCRISNGGQIVLSQLSQELSRMGYEVYVFDHLDRLDRVNWRWLNLGQALFRDIPFDEVIANTNVPIITGWLDALLDSEGGLVGGLDPQRIRYWGGEILRNNLPKSRQFILDNLPKIAIPNGTLEPYYRQIGYEGEIITLDNWIRSDLFHPAAEKRRAGTVGYQRDNFVFSVLPTLLGAFDKRNDASRFKRKIIMCEGDQMAVARKMQKSDYFVFWNRHCDAISLFKGETFGLSLFEAMACGCIPIARWHQGIDFLREEILVIVSDDPSEIRKTCDWLEADPEEKEKYRARALETSEFFRFDNPRKEAIRRLLE